MILTGNDETMRDLGVIRKDSKEAIKKWESGKKNFHQIRGGRNSRGRQH